MSKLSELVEELQEELAETKNQLSSLEEEHEYLENSFEMYKEEMKKTMEYYKQNMYLEMVDLRRTLEALRGKSFITDAFTPPVSAPTPPQKTFDPNTMLLDRIYPPNPTVKELKSRFVDLNTVK